MRSAPGGRNIGPVTGLSVGLGALVGVGLGAATGRWGLWMPLCVGLGVLVAVLFKVQSKQSSTGPSGRAEPAAAADGGRDPGSS